MKSNRPYLLRALYEWIIDNGMTPYLLIDATRIENNIPDQSVEDGKLTLNLHPDAAIDLHMGNEWITCKTRFNGVSHNIELSTESVLAIYAKENGRGMLFSEDKLNTDTSQEKTDESRKPVLKIVK